jgi:hypothetical protein
MKACYFTDKDVCYRWTCLYPQAKLDVMVSWLNKNVEKLPNQPMTWKDSKQSMTYNLYSEDGLVSLVCTAEKYQSTNVQDDVESDSLEFQTRYMPEFQKYLFDENGIIIDIDLPTFSFKTEKELITLKQTILKKIAVLENIYDKCPKSKLAVEDIYKIHRKGFDDFYCKDYQKERAEWKKEGYKGQFQDYNVWLRREGNYYHLYGYFLYYNENVLVYELLKEFSGYHHFCERYFIMIDLNTITIIDEQILFEKKDFDKITDLLTEQFAEDYSERGNPVKPNGNCYFDYNIISNKWNLVWLFQSGEILAYVITSPTIEIELSKLEPYLKIDISPYISSEGLVFNRNSIE